VKGEGEGLCCLPIHIFTCTDCNLPTHHFYLRSLPHEAHSKQHLAAIILSLSKSAASSHTRSASAAMFANLSVNSLKAIMSDDINDAEARRLVSEHRLSGEVQEVQPAIETLKKMSKESSDGEKFGGSAVLGSLMNPNMKFTKENESAAVKALNVTSTHSVCLGEPADYDS
jgi:hypothetical protein